MDVNQLRAKLHAKGVKTPDSFKPNATEIKAFADLFDIHAKHSQALYYLADVQNLKDTPVIRAELEKIAEQLR